MQQHWVIPKLKRQASIKMTRFSVSEFMTLRTLYEPVSSWSLERVCQRNKEWKKSYKKIVVHVKAHFFSEDVCAKCLVFEQQKNFYVMHGQFKHYMQSLFPNMENWMSFFSSFQ